MPGSYGETGRGRAGLIFLFGVIMGVAGTLVLPRVLGPMLPGSLRDGRIVEGEVVEKVLDGDRLLLKVRTKEESFLATFVRRQKDVNLLVDRGDLVTLEVAGANPFPVDPGIESVRSHMLPGSGASIPLREGVAGRSPSGQRGRGRIHRAALGVRESSGREVIGRAWCARSGSGRA
jgi:hypothetical protein